MSARLPSIVHLTDHVKSVMRAASPRKKWPSLLLLPGDIVEKTDNKRRPNFIAYQVRTCLCVYVYIYIYIYICVCVCVCVYIYIYVCVCTYIYMYVCMYIYIYIYIYIYLCLCVCIYIYIYICVCMYICVCVCICVYIDINIYAYIKPYVPTYTVYGGCLIWQIGESDCSHLFLYRPKHLFMHVMACQLS